MIIGSIIYTILGIAYFMENWKKPKVKKGLQLWNQYFGDGSILLLIVLIVPLWPIWAIVDIAKNQKK